MKAANGRLPATDLVQRAAAVAAECAGPAADDVDRRARFPCEAVRAMRDADMMSCLVPPSLGGDGAGLGTVGAATLELSRECASSGMVYAMHCLQVALLADHATSPELRDYLSDLVRHQYLLASATTEVGTGGDLRSSVCAVEQDGSSYRLEKQAPVISYGEHADAILATARRTPASPPSDQVLVLCEAPDYSLEPISGWDTLGLRGTCSSGFVLRAEGPVGHVLATPFGPVAAQTMVPVSHILWGHVWLGIAVEALDRARRSVQVEARKSPGVTSLSALRLAELTGLYDLLASLVRGAARTFDDIAGDADALSKTSFTATMNSLKVNASTLVVRIVEKAMAVCGIAAYRLDSPYTMGRLLRDAYGASLMVNNDRILANNAQLLLMDRGAL